METMRRHVESIVRPIRASGWRKDRMRAELLDHLTEAFQAQRESGLDDSAAAEAACNRLGQSDAVQQELQAAVPALERIMFRPLPSFERLEHLFERDAPETRLRFVAVRTGYVLAAIFVVQVAIFSLQLVGESTGLVPRASLAVPRLACLDGLLQVNAVVAGSTALALYLVDVLGLGHVMSRKGDYSAATKAAALAAVVTLWYATFLPPVIVLAELIRPKGDPSVWQVLTADQPMRVYAVCLGLFVFVALPATGWMMRREHERYTKWGELKVE